MPSFGMLHSVILVRIDVSEERRIPEDSIFHSYRREYLKSCISDWNLQHNFPHVDWLHQWHSDLQKLDKSVR
jgi:hypothetical protein